MRGSLVISGDYTYKKIKKVSLINKIYNSIIYTIFYIIFTFYALFADDIRHFVSNKQIDQVFYFVFGLTFIFFVVDMILLIIKKRKKYFYSILFFLDLVGTFSLLLDIGWINEMFFNSTDMNVYGVLARGARSALLANSAFKYLEIFRYFKNIRLSNLFTCSVFHSMKDHLTKKKEKEKRRLESYKRNKIINEDKNNKPNGKKTIKDIYLIGREMKEEKETTISNSGQEVSTLFTQRTAILILILMCLIPIFYAESYYRKKLTSYETDLYTIQYYINSLNKNKDDLLLDKGFNDMWEEYKKINIESDYELLKLILYDGNKNIIKEFPADNVINEDDIIKDFRYYEIRSFKTDEKKYLLVSWFSIVKYLNIDAFLNILRTFFVLFLLFISVYFYSVEMNNLLIEPLEKMMDNVFEINKNPIEAYKKIKKMNKKVEKKDNVWGKQEMDELIEKLFKSCKLLSLGFGEAGNELIVKKLKGNNLSFKTGKKIMAIFGFCHIRSFSKYTEELRDEILEFINSISYIVHYNVEKNEGKVNKNIGDTYLIVWKFNDTITEYLLLEEQNKNELLDLEQSKKFKNEITKKCEFSIRSFIHTLISIKKKDYLVVLNQTQNKEINKKRHKKNILNCKCEIARNYNIEMSFGLHMGYAIEGAIGSNYKIDLSYLSPHVNLASRVMAVTSQYNLNLLISDEVIKNVSKTFKNEFRIIDIVYLKGSKQAIQLYTFDLDTREKTLKKLKEKKMSKRKEILFCREIYKKDFFVDWNKGFRFYIDGDWKKAHKIFLKLKTFINEVDDGPCVNLINFIESNNFLSPQGWAGVRSLKKK